jgi:hypothetical protein
MRNNIKIRFEKPVYNVDEKNGVVVCTLRYKAAVPETVIFASESTMYGSRWRMTQIVKTVARAKDNDSFDVNVGKKVSLAKAENLAYSHVNEWAKTALKSLCGASDAIVEFSRKTKKVREHNVEYMKKF